MCGLGYDRPVNHLPAHSQTSASAAESVYSALLLTGPYTAHMVFVWGSGQETASLLFATPGWFVMCRVPLQYLNNCCHWRDFILAVGPGTLIPRPETEILIDLAQQVDTLFEASLYDSAAPLATVRCTALLCCMVHADCTGAC